MDEFETREERLARLNRERVKRFKSKHSIKLFSVEIEQEHYDKIVDRLAKDNVTRKDFLLKSFERYEKEGGVL